MPTTTAAAELRFQAMGCDVHVRRALQGARVTGGRYDPTVLGDVLRAGYDRSFEQLARPRPRRRAAGWHPLVVAWGILGLYLLLAVELTSLARTSLPRGLWWRVHYASFVVFAATTVHGLTASRFLTSPGRPAVAQQGAPGRATSPSA